MRDYAETRDNRPEQIQYKAPKGQTIGVGRVLHDYRRDMARLHRAAATVNGSGGNAVMQLEESEELSGTHDAAARNGTGLPDDLKSGVENLSGLSLDDVQVHYNSDKPGQVQAHAYTQGSDIHVAPGQEKHLSHEAWHVVQQKQGRVRPTLQFSDGLNVNDDAGLEREADIMGGRALFQTALGTRLFSPQLTPLLLKKSSHTDIRQFSFLSWIKQSAKSLFDVTAGALIRVPKHVFDFVKHITFDLIRSIYHAIIRPNANGGVGLMQEQDIAKSWFSGLILKFLDIFNLREIAGFLATLLGTPLSKVRGLTTAERALAREIFGDSINLHNVTILENSAIAGITAGAGGAFTAAHTIHAGQGFNTPQGQAILMHELMHIAQEQKQGMLSWIELEWGRRRTRAAPVAGFSGNADYDYGLIAAGTRFRDFSREQQGAIIQDYAGYLQAHQPNVRDQADMINGTYGAGTYGNYNAMLQGLSMGRWWFPWQNSQWKQTIG